MKMSHVHVQVRDLKATLHWLDRVLGVQPQYQNERMASVHFSDEGSGIIFDASDVDSPVTIAFDSQNCEGDFLNIVTRAKGDLEVIEKPTKQPWGVIAAYLKGPAELTFEIEQVL